ncbi:PorP/SprF family type IX secretion system membrane protein [Reichenbachiella versicolor]|uniref:PorP/SprF family type IX secretion system membrane protein n=1 Tax=Reichenbachiella versicolor TaxID=1821036 RepID=UPI000D6E8074|nr:PorP/SprF family type IX secretion system membrane protein [Reichenbachiella versicolor]
MKRLLLYIFLGIPLTSFSQEGQFSQYFASGSLMNPAFAGTVNTINFNANFKQAGKPEQDTYQQLMQGTFTYPLRRITTREEYFGSIGATFFSEKRGFQGLFRHQKVMLNGAYTLDLSELRNQMLVFGLQGGVVQQDLSSSAFRWGSQYNQYYGYDDTRSGEALSTSPVWYPVFNFGVIYSTYDNDDLKIRDYSFTAGISADNLNSPNVALIDGDESKKPMLFKVFSSLQFPLGARFYGHPSAYALYSNGSTQLNVGMYISTFVSTSRSNLGVELQTGAWYRVEDSFIALVGVKVEQIKVGFSVDMNATDLGLEQDAGGNFSAYEVSLTYNFELHKSYRRISSPIF